MSDQQLTFGILGPLEVRRRRRATVERQAAAPPPALLLTPGAVVTADRLEWVKRAVDLADAGLTAAGDRDDAALQPLHVLGVIALYRGELDEARTWSRQEVARAKRAGDAYQASFGKLLDVLAHCYGGAPDKAALRELHPLAGQCGSPSRAARPVALTGRRRGAGPHRPVGADRVAAPTRLDRASGAHKEN